MVISTCNRVEYYVASSSLEAFRDRVKAVIASFAGAESLGHLYAHEGDAALVHLFRVSSSLDSMVLGEPQILGQLKDAYELRPRAWAGPR